jgi:hypothetical protein
VAQSGLIALPIGTRPAATGSVGIAVRVDDVADGLDDVSQSSL